MYFSSVCEELSKEPIPQRTDFCFLWNCCGITPTWLSTPISEDFPTWIFPSPFTDKSLLTVVEHWRSYSFLNLKNMVLNSTFQGWAHTTLQIKTTQRHHRKMLTYGIFIWKVVKRHRVPILPTLPYSDSVTPDNFCPKSPIMTRVMVSHRAH